MVFVPAGLPIGVAIQHALLGFIVMQTVVSSLTAAPSLITPVSYEVMPYLGQFALIVKKQVGGAAALATVLAGSALVNLAAGGGERSAVRFGHPSGTLRVGAEARQVNGEWTVTKAIMSRSARVLMEGWVRVPGDSF